MRKAALVILLSTFAIAQDFPALPRGRSASARLEPDRLEAVHEARERFARDRTTIPPVGVYREFKVVMHVHAEDSNHTFGTRADVLRAAKAAGASVVMFTDHRGPKPETWHGFRDGILFFAGGEDNHLQTYPRPAPGLRFHSHVEEQMDAPVDGMDGMEIYNRHADMEDDDDLLAFLGKLNDDPAGRRAFAALARKYPDEVYGAGCHYWAEIFARWDKILETRKFPGVHANDAHQNQILDDGAGGKVLLDPYEIAFRNTSTHVLARTLDESSVQEALRAGRSFISHDWLCDATGFVLVASNNLGMYQMGDTIPLAGRTELVARTPATALLRVIHQGKVIAQQTGERIAVPLTQRGAYRVEAWLDVDGELRPWIYSNPIYAEPLDPTSVRLPSNELAAEVEAIRNLPYVDGTVEEKQKLDVYRAKGKEKRPVLFFVHGGAWRRGDRSQYPPLGNRIAREGYVVVIPSYRLAPKDAWPAQIDDVKAAFEWTRTHVAEYGGDPERIVVAGHSAGGHLVSVLAMREQGIRAVVSVSGVYEIGAVADARGDVFGRDPAVWREASPLSHVRRDLPRFTIAYCQWDYLSLPQQAEQFAAALTKAGVRSETVYIPGEGHISEMLRINEPANVIARLFTQALRGVDNQ